MIEQAKPILEKDPDIAPMLRRYAISPPEGDGRVYQQLLRSITSQQLSSKAADTIYSRFLQLFDRKTPTPEQLIGTEIGQLRDAGLSRSKAAYLHQVARHFQQEGADMDWQAMTDEQIIRHLTQIKGVGRWTAEMILIFTLNRPDVWPVDDLVIRKAMIERFELSGSASVLKEKMMERAEAWRPWRSVVSLYLWKWYHDPER